MSDGGDLAAWVDRLVDAARTGTIVDLRAGAPGRHYDPATADEWPASRHIPAEAIRAVLIGDTTGFDPRGLGITGARITGDIDFAHIRFEFPLRLMRCRIDQPMDLACMSLGQLELDGSHLRALWLDGATVTDGLSANRITADGEIRAIGATIGGQLNLNYAYLANPRDDVLSLDGATVTRGLFADHITAHGGIRAIGATICGQVSLGGAHLSNPRHDVLILNAAIVTGDLIADRITAEGEICAIGITISGQLRLNGANLANPQCNALSLDDASIAGGLVANRIAAHGGIRAIGATISGQLSLSGAHLTNPEGSVLSLDGASIAGGLFADHITAHGEIRAIGATISGQLSLSGAHLANPGDDVLSLDGASITRGLFASRITTLGGIRAPGATVGGQLNLGGAQLANPHGNALTLDGASVTRELIALDDSAGHQAVSRFRADGRISARGARFEGHVYLSDAKPQLLGFLAIGLDGAVIRELTLPAEGPRVINLSRTKIGNLNTPKDLEPPYRVMATGWEIGDVHGYLRTNNAAATRWLARGQKVDISPQPWHALATVYERNGHPAEARRLRFTAANRVTKAAPSPATKLVRRVYQVVAGHGYYPLLAAVWLILALAGGYLLVDLNRAHFVPANPGAATTVMTAAADTFSSGNETPTEVKRAPTITGADCDGYSQYPCLDSFSYALAGVIPAATGVTRPEWTISTDAPLWVKAGVPTLRILAWIFTAILLAGVTGLLRKSS